MTSVVAYQQFFFTDPWLFIVIVGILGTIIGSFINVVICRLPLMLEREWQEHAREILGDNNKPNDAPHDITLLHPRSTCPHCHNKIKAWHNIPIISFLHLRGKCAYCHEKIAGQYIIIESICGLFAGYLAWFFGVDFTLLAALIFTFGLIPLFVIDLDHQVLPDQITLPLLWAGLMANLFGFFSDLQDAVIGAIMGYLVLWIIYWTFKAITKKEGMGHHFIRNYRSNNFL